MIAVQPSHLATRQDTKPNGGPDGDQIAGRVHSHLAYLSTLARQLHVPDPVEQYFAPVVGKWSLIHEEAEKWRAAATTAEDTTTDLKKPLGALDAAWEGKDSEAFIAYIGKVGIAGADMSDAMRGMATALDKLADGIRSIVQQMADMLTSGAEDASQAMAMPVRSEQKVRHHLDQMDRPSAELFKAVRRALEAFVKLCDEVHGDSAFGAAKMKHQMPSEKLTLPSYEGPKNLYHGPKHAGEHDDGHTATHDGDAQPSEAAAASAGHAGGSASDATSGSAGGASGQPAALRGGGGASAGSSGGSAAMGQPPAAGAVSGAAEELGKHAASAPAAAAAGGAAAAGERGGDGMPMMPMMGGMAGGMGGDKEYKSKRKLAGDVSQIFGDPEHTAPRVIGDEEDPPPRRRKK